MKVRVTIQTEQESGDGATIRREIVTEEECKDDDLESGACVGAMVLRAHVAFLGSLRSEESEDQPDEISPEV